MNENATFLELGFDSLFLTQANSAIRKKFKVKLTFRQLFEEAPTIAALAAYLDRQLPADAYALERVVVAQAAATNAPVIQETLTQSPIAATQPLSAAAANTLERVIEQQLQTLRQVMAEQLAMLGKGSANLGVVNQVAVNPAAVVRSQPARLQV